MTLPESGNLYALLTSGSRARYGDLQRQRPTAPGAMSRHHRREATPNDTSAGIHMYSSSMADTTIKITEEVRDRLRLLAEERGMSTRAFVERLANSTPTERERAERTATGIAYVRAHFGVELTDDDLREADAWRAAVAAGEVGGRR